MQGVLIISAIFIGIITQSGGLLFCSIICLGEFLKDKIFSQEKIFYKYGANNGYKYYYSKLYVQRFLNLVSLIFIIIIYTFLPVFLKPSTELLYAQVILLIGLFYIYRYNHEVLSCVVISFATFITPIYELASTICMFFILYTLWKYVALFIDTLMSVFEKSLPESFFEELEYQLLSIDEVSNIKDVVINGSEMSIAVEFSTLDNVAFINQKIRNIAWQLIEEHNLTITNIFIDY